MRCLLLAGSALATALAIAGRPARTQMRPLTHRWVYLAHNLLPDENVPVVEGLLRRAAAAGYSGAVLADYKLNILDRMDERYFRHVDRIRKVARELRMELVPCVFPIGYSSGLLAHDPSLVEAMPVRDAEFRVRQGAARLVPDPDARVANGGFEESVGHRVAGWALQDEPGQATLVDREVRHGGAASLRLQDLGATNPPAGNGRVMQSVRLKPFRCYRVSFWARTRGLDTPGSVNCVVLPPRQGAPSLTHISLGVAPDQDWKLHQTVFNSQDNSSANLYIGVWGGRRGALWIDDVRLEEIGLVNVVRRDGCPLVVKGEDGTVYAEGRDYEPVRDPRMGTVPWEGEFELWHEPLDIRLAASSRIREGQRLRVSFYHPGLVHEGQAAACLTHPKVYALLRDQMERVQRLFQPATVFMQHDEIRCANWCGLCQARGVSPGRLLADNARRCVEIVRRASPQARVCVWSDMFDPHHNARGDYYLVNGSWAGSWEGLASDVVIVNWNAEQAARSLPFFAGRGHRQILAGYYDGDPAATLRWLETARGVRGVEGLMYTTWANRYDDLERFAGLLWRPAPK